MTKAKEEIRSVPSSPEKDFFVSMLTRDIELQDAVLDLLDNCVDGAIRVRSKAMQEKDSFDGYWANISFDENRFVIEDNCGGIPWEIAKNSAFRMGKPAEHKEKPGTIGVVGIGMKRAIFKMGRECLVHSNHSDDSFLVTIPPDWFRADDWEDFDAKREKPSKGGRYGTIIEISELLPDSKKSFAEGSSFRTSFIEAVSEAYSILIEKGFEVKINNKVVPARPVRLYFEDRETKAGEIQPYLYKGKFGNVEVFLAVGYRSPLRSQDEQDDESNSSFAARDAGWTVVCNDRVVLSNDRTIKTGWGFGGVPNFHNQFSCIAGIVEFHSPNIADLPITTTKRGIDTGKDIYTLVRQRMQEGLKLFTRNTNRWKGAEEELKGRFERQGTLDLAQLKKIKPSFSVLRGEGQQRVYKPELPEFKKNETTKRMCFTREIKDIERVSMFLFGEIRDPNDVAETCFDRVLIKAAK